MVRSYIVRFFSGGRCLRLWVCAGALLIAGCSDPEPRVYSVARERVSAPTQESGVPSMPAREAATMPTATQGDAGLHWTVPELWQEFPAEGMRYANFKTAAAIAEGGVTVNVFRFPGEAGGLLANVNRWRNELKLPPLSADELPNNGTQMTVAGLQMFIVDMQATEGEPPRRTLGAIFRHGPDSWFVKMEGQSQAVQENMQNFIDFIRSLHFHE